MFIKRDLRRYAAPYAPRSGAPIEIIGKVILRHANLAAAQRYLDKVADIETILWIKTCTDNPGTMGVNRLINPATMHIP